MRVIAVALSVVLLASCAPAPGFAWDEGVRWPDHNGIAARPWRDPKPPVVVVVPVPPVAQPPISKPVEPEPPVVIPSPQPPFVPVPVEPPACRVKTMPEASAIERIIKCPGERPQLVRRR